MPKCLFLVALIAACTLLSGCEKCLGGGRNGTPEPGADEYQLVFSNIVSRETVVHVDGEKVGEVCMETEYATIGNFPVNEDSRIMIHSKLSGSDCYVSPNCSSDCGAQTCDGEPAIDTTPFAGTVFNTGFIWRQ